MDSHIFLNSLSVIATLASVIAAGGMIHINMTIDARINAFENRFLEKLDDRFMNMKTGELQMSHLATSVYDLRELLKGMEKRIQ